MATEITQVADRIGLTSDELELYGRFKAKVNLHVLERLASKQYSVGPRWGGVLLSLFTLAGRASAKTGRSWPAKLKPNEARLQLQLPSFEE